VKFSSTAEEGFIETVFKNWPLIEKSLALIFSELGLVTEILVSVLKGLGEILRKNSF